MSGHMKPPVGPANCGGWSNQFYQLSYLTERAENGYIRQEDMPSRPASQHQHQSEVMMPPAVITLLRLTTTASLASYIPPVKLRDSNATQTKEKIAAQDNQGTDLAPALPLWQPSIHYPQGKIPDPESNLAISLPILTAHHEALVASEEFLKHSTLPGKEESSPVNDLICLITLPVSNFVAMLAGLPSSLCSALSTDVDQL